MPDGACARSEITVQVPSWARPRSAAAITSGLQVTHRGPGHRPDETGVPEDHLGREDPFAQQALLAVQVDEDRVEQLGALGQPDLERAPLGAH